MYLRILCLKVAWQRENLLEINLSLLFLLMLKPALNTLWLIFCQLLMWDWSLQSWSPPCPEIKKGSTFCHSLSISKNRHPEIHKHLHLNYTQLLSQPPWNTKLLVGDHRKPHLGVDSSSTFDRSCSSGYCQDLRITAKDISAQWRKDGLHEEKTCLQNSLCVSQFCRSKKNGQQPIASNCNLSQQQASIEMRASVRAFVIKESHIVSLRPRM